MARKYFGTDGIRGQANKFPMTPEVAMKVGMAAGLSFQRGNHRHRVVVGKDTRLSGYMLENALVSGFCAAGMDVFLLGPIPTPAVAMLSRSLRADLGVMISASHNPYQDNGIKLFGPKGYKLSDEIEVAIEAEVAAGLAPRASADLLGRAKRLDDAGGRYIEFVKATLPRQMRLDGLKIVIDCANGAAYKVAPTVLWELGAEVIPLGVAPDGLNINKDCGTVTTAAMQREVVARGADIGIALDGDADRLLVADEQGRLLDGDQLMALIATSWHRADKVTGGGVVATVMSNLGLERYIQNLGLDFHRTVVGDRYVVEQMRETGCNIGGEQSGHIILSNHSTTGDGLIAALQILATLVESEQSASEICNVFTAVPQLLKNVRFGPGAPLEAAAVKAAISAAEHRLGRAGRLLIRRSGTERLIRVMAEGEDEALIAAIVDEICAAIAAASPPTKSHAAE
jgi:phosphoglucosamine mutase